MATVRVKVPATTGNLGSGFDCLGMALELYNTAEISDEADGLVVEIEGEGAALIPRDETNVCVRAARAVCNRVNFHPRGLRFRLLHAIPVSRGLGSSGVAIIAGAVAANELAGRPLDTTELLRVCTDLEGHPDNVVPSLLGGLSVSGERDGTIIYQTFHIPEKLMAIVAVPDFTLDTAVARGVLPQSVSMHDAVYNLCSVGLLVGGILGDDYSLLRAGMDDRLHQPYRERLIPGLRDVITAALDTGAHGAALSGAGPTVIALASESQTQIAEAMAAAFYRHDITSRTMILHIDNKGTSIIP